MRSEPTPRFWSTSSGGALALRDRRGRTVEVVSAPELGPWEPLELDSVVDLFASASFRWWVSGGRALDLHVGRTWRHHEDTDVGIVRRDAGALHALLARWDLHVAAAGRLTRWHGAPLSVARPHNNVWCRQSPNRPWALDVTIGEGSDRHWVFRRDPSVRVPWDAAILRTAAGVPYLAPELQLLYKSKAPRPKDDHDAREVIPALDDRQRRLLSQRLGADHPWQAHLT